MHPGERKSVIDWQEQCKREAYPLRFCSDPKLYGCGLNGVLDSI